MKINIFTKIVIVLLVILFSTPILMNSARSVSYDNAPKKRVYKERCPGPYRMNEEHKILDLCNMRLESGNAPVPAEDVQDIYACEFSLVDLRRTLLLEGSACPGEAEIFANSHYNYDCVSTEPIENMQSICADGYKFADSWIDELDGQKVFRYRCNLDREIIYSPCREIGDETLDREYEFIPDINDYGPYQYCCGVLK